MQLKPMRRLRSSVVLLTAVVLAGACNDSTAPTRDGPLVVTVRPGRLVVQNVGSELLYTFALTRDATAVVDWIPCSDPARCDGIAPGARREVPYSEIYDYTRETREIVVYGWHLVPNGNGFAVDRMRFVIVRLR
jgi:hypothetical protein